ncbi:MAG: Nudix family hydrolase [Pseudomonadota bacterium]|nr:Nudix family hydrolase [Pseudomonadota bacterium]
MAGADQRQLVQVVAGVLLAPDQSFLLASRPPGKVYAGYWEFPGGKVEAGESPRAALDRELEEELGVRPTRADPWLVREFSYPHARVRIRFFRVSRWEGKPHAREGQALQWHPPGPPALTPMLPANGPILRALALPERYGITAAGRIGEPHALLGVRQALQRGVRLIQVREKSFSPARLRLFAAQVVELARAAGARVLVNSDPATALACAADGVHLEARRLMALTQRPELPLVAASCHDDQELEHADRLGLDFAVWGPVRATDSHPGTAGRGWPAFAHAVQGRELPVYAIGGLGEQDLATAHEHGAQGIAAIGSLMVPR